MSALSFSGDGKYLTIAVSPGFEDGKEGVGDGMIDVFMRLHRCCLSFHQIKNASRRIQDTILQDDESASQEEMGAGFAA